MRSRSRASSAPSPRSKPAGSPIRSCRSSIPQQKGEPLVVDRDEHPRADSCLEALARLRPAFKTEGGTVTAGNSSGINDGASAVLLVEAGRATRAGAPTVGPRRVDRGRRRRPGGHGHRAHPGHAQGARAGRDRRRRPRPRRAQRGVRVAVARVHRRARARSGQGQRQRRGDRAGSSARDERRPPHHDAHPRAAPDGWATSAWPRCASASGRGSRPSWSAWTKAEARQPISNDSRNRQTHAR